MKIDIIITVFSHSDEPSWFCLGGTYLPAGIIIIFLESAGVFSQPRHHTSGAIYKEPNIGVIFLFVFGVFLVLVFGFFFPKTNQFLIFPFVPMGLQTSSPAAITAESSQLMVTLLPVEPDCSSGTVWVSCMCLVSWVTPKQTAFFPSVFECLSFVFKGVAWKMVHQWG